MINFAYLWDQMGDWAATILFIALMFIFGSIGLDWIFDRIGALVAWWRR